jgi:2'-hydroxyisoflavone reductase
MKVLILGGTQFIGRHIVILGGTRFIGRHIVEALLAGGHSVSVFNRGRTPDELPASVERLRGDRDEGASGLNALGDRSWDVCVDVSGYTPRQVRPSIERLSANVSHYVFVSAVSVYGDPRERPVRETHSRLPPAGDDVTEVSGETYGPLKVACEDIVQGVFDDRCTLLRPQVVVGRHDPDGRLTYWVQRAARGGEMLAPGDGSDHLQAIDARDLARFTRTVVENRVGGTFNLAGPKVTWAEFMRVLGARDIVWVAGEIIRAAGVREFELPLYRPVHGPRASLMDVSNAAAVAAGLELTDFAVTVKDVRDWLIDREATPSFSPEREAELIRIARHVPPPGGGG